MNVTVLEYDPQMAQEELREVLSQMDPAALAAELFGETSSDAAVPDLPEAAQLDVEDSLRSEFDRISALDPAALAAELFGDFDLPQL